MSATCTRTHNRVAAYLDTPSVVVPVDPAARQAVLGDAVIATIFTLQKLLGNEDPMVALKAAGMILDLEKTRMRHGRDVSGMVNPTPPEPEPATNPESSDVDGADKASIEDEFVERNTDDYWRELQSIADEKGTGEVVCREKAARMVRSAYRQAQGLLATPPPVRS